MYDKPYLSFNGLSTFYSNFKEWINTNFVNSSITVNNKRLNQNISLDYNDVNADMSGSATNALNEANKYTDTQIANLVDSAPDTLNTLGKLSIAFQENDDVIDILDEAITNKAEKADLTSHISNAENPHNVTASQLGLLTEVWTFTLNDGTAITKEVVVR